VSGREGIRGPLGMLAPSRYACEALRGCCLRGVFSSGKRVAGVRLRCNIPAVAMAAAADLLTPQLCGAARDAHKKGYDCASLCLWGGFLKKSASSVSLCLPAVPLAVSEPTGSALPRAMSSARITVQQSMLVHTEGWVLKKPTAAASKSWSEARPQRRYLESRGFVVEYYAAPPSSRSKGSKPRGSFDLRDVTILRESTDPTAPAASVDLTAKKHAFTLGFESTLVRDGFLAVWVNAVPLSAVPRTLSERWYDQTICHALATMAEGENIIPPLSPHTSLIRQELQAASTPAAAAPTQAVSDAATPTTSKGMDDAGPDPSPAVSDSPADMKLVDAEAAAAQAAAEAATAAAAAASAAQAAEKAAEAAKVEATAATVLQSARRGKQARLETKNLRAKAAAVRAVADDGTAGMELATQADSGEPFPDPQQQQALAEQAAATSTAAAALSVQKAEVALQAASRLEALATEAEKDGTPPSTNGADSTDTTERSVTTDVTSERSDGGAAQPDAERRQSNPGHRVREANAAVTLQAVQRRRMAERALADARAALLKATALSTVDTNAIGSAAVEDDSPFARCLRPICKCVVR
jgi:hypothetical protein